MTRWVLGQLAREAKRDPVKYNDFYQEFGAYIKEGACTDRVSRPTSQQLFVCAAVQPRAVFSDQTGWFCLGYGQANMEAISKLLRFESSAAISWIDRLRAAWRPLRRGATRLASRLSCVGKVHGLVPSRL